MTLHVIGDLVSDTSDPSFHSYFLFKGVHWGIYSQGGGRNMFGNEASFDCTFRGTSSISRRP